VRSLWLLFSCQRSSRERLGSANRATTGMTVPRTMFAAMGRVAGRRCWARVARRLNHSWTGCVSIPDPLRSVGGRAPPRAPRASAAVGHGSHRFPGLPMSSASSNQACWARRVASAPAGRESASSSARSTRDDVERRSRSVPISTVILARASSARTPPAIASSPRPATRIAKAVTRRLVNARRPTSDRPATTAIRVPRQVVAKLARFRGSARSVSAGWARRLSRHRRQRYLRPTRRRPPPR